MSLLPLTANNDRLRQHQAEAKAKIYEAWAICNSVMLQMPTGTGKTYLFTSIINDIVNASKKVRREVHILVVAHRTELIDQISTTLNRFEVAHGFIQGPRQQQLFRRVQVASIMSVLTSRNYYNIERLNYDYIIIDEAHHSIADTYQRLFEMFPEAKKLGVTATPWRFNHESFKPLYDILIQSPQISWFIEHHLLSDFDYVSIRPDSDIQRLVDATEVSPMGDFVNSELDNALNQQRIRSRVFESYRKFAMGRKGIIYAINKKHAAKLAALYNKNGIASVAIDCDTPKEDRQRLIDRFKAGEILVLVNVNIFTEGFDCPDVSFIQLARPTRSLALYLQQVGRGLRMVEGKSKTIIIDNVGLYNYFGLPDRNRRWLKHFIGKDDGEADEIECNNQVTQRCNLTEINDKCDEERFKEDDEEMMLVRGSTSYKSIISRPQNKENDESNLLNQRVELLSELNICDYYLAIGSPLKFKIYIFRKRKGKLTQDVGGCVYQYDQGCREIVFTSNPKSNAQLINKDEPLKAILEFCSLLSGMSATSTYNLMSLCEAANVSKTESAGLFEVLGLLAKAFKNRQSQSSSK